VEIRHSRCNHDVPAEPADYDSAGEALAKAIKKAVDLGVTSVAVPALGMGVGDLSRNSWRKLMPKY